MAKIFRVRKPRLRISKRGKVSLSGGGISVGGRNARINLSKSGVSTSFGVPGIRYNSRRGLTVGGGRRARRGQACGCIFLLALGLAGGVLGSIGMMVLSIAS